MEMMMSCEGVAALLEDPDVVVIDCRWPVRAGTDGYRLFTISRIPGARYLGFDATQSSRGDGVLGRAIAPELLAASLARLGVGANSLVVAYDDNHQFTAARLVWLLRMYGFERSFRLDGGFPAWMRTGARVECGAPADVPSGRDGGPALRYSSSAVAVPADVMRLREISGTVLDCRRDESWVAEPHRIQGATRISTRTLLDPDGLALDAHRIRELMAARGVGLNAEIITYCGASLSAAAVWLLLRSAGMPHVRLYDGSLTEWITKGLPLE
ncbi:rhodanese-like domain-containing protein [Streptomyces sp. RKAG293]|uniref:sulfurtransferase n=1 Tax=Streptomyces sp. RKAG293 TaxID=2893403 RepID=UPI00203456C1|nr:rhodanese-like domain-containing protein [Streptomyces sp. RKAG293]MCM2416569.1 hypothetical protein [Streptomyces sp. RKAG293]